MQSAKGIPKRESTFILCQRPMPKQISTQHVADTFSHDLPFCANSRCEWELVETYQRSCLHSDCVSLTPYIRCFVLIQKLLPISFCICRWKSFFLLLSSDIYVRCSLTFISFRLLTFFLCVCCYSFHNYIIVAKALLAQMFCFLAAF